MAGSIPASVIASAVVPVPVRARHVSPALEAWRRFCRHKMAVVSLVILLSMVLLVVFGPLLWKVAINDIDFSARLKGPSRPGIERVPTATPARFKALGLSAGAPNAPRSVIW